MGSSIQSERVPYLLNVRYGRFKKQFFKVSKALSKYDPRKPENNRLDLGGWIILKEEYSLGDIHAIILQKGEKQIFYIGEDLADEQIFSNNKDYLEEFCKDNGVLDVYIFENEKVICQG